MITITQQQYLFLLSIGVPFDGRVEGMGRAVIKPVNTASASPACGAIAPGTFYTTSYVAAVIPEPQPTITDNEVLSRIMKVRPDGGYDLYDIHTKRTLSFGNNIKTHVNIDTRQNHIDIKIEDTNGNRYETSTRLNDFLAEIDDSSLPAGRLAFDSFGALFDYSQYRFERMKTGQKSKHVYDAYRWMKKNLNYKPKIKPSVVYKQKLPQFYRYGGKVLFWVSASMIGYDIAFEQKAIKSSHTLDGAMLGISTVPPYGWAVGLTYFAIDAGISIITNKSIGDYLDEYLHENTGLNNSILWDFK